MITQLEWLNRNNTRRYPFIDNIVIIPDNIFVDAHITLPNTYLANKIFVRNLRVTPTHISCYITTRDLTTQKIRLLGFINTNRNLKPYQPVSIAFRIPQAIGYFVLGTFFENGSSYFIARGDRGAVELELCASVISYVRPVTSTTISYYSHELKKSLQVPINQNTLTLIGDNGIIIQKEKVYIDSESTPQDAFVIKVDRNNNKLKNIVHNCDKPIEYRTLTSDGSSSGLSSNSILDNIITSINHVQPNENGEIILRIESGIYTQEFFTPYPIDDNELIPIVSGASTIDDPNFDQNSGYYNFPNEEFLTNGLKNKPRDKLLKSVSVDYVRPGLVALKDRERASTICENRNKFRVYLDLKEQAGRSDCSSGIRAPIIPLPGPDGRSGIGVTFAGCYIYKDFLVVYWALMMPVDLKSKDPSKIRILNESGAFIASANSVVKIEGIAPFVPKVIQFRGFTPLQKPTVGKHAYIVYRTRFMKKFTPYKVHVLQGAVETKSLVKDAKIDLENPEFKDDTLRYSLDTDAPPPRELT